MNKSAFLGLAMGALTACAGHEQVDPAPNTPNEAKLLFSAFEAGRKDAAIESRIQNSRMKLGEGIYQSCMEGAYLPCTSAGLQSIEGMRQFPPAPGTIKKLSAKDGMTLIGLQEACRERLIVCMDIIEDDMGRVENRRKKGEMPEPASTDDEALDQ